ncbi:biopolymer transporter ExbB [Pseudothioclava arenosa]|uniref:Biopolymer transporter ExbB n=1 Tax=Pseudothioclava arenosa TaxID=1795308 RepID=A0A2A4CS70_9RHOB|nr:biopolymer transporter ExbB [Pseudothioclava arenosa]PCD76999.1 biopolymer transporter ExbB [Pseudothioclava arenosa]
MRSKAERFETHFSQPVRQITLMLIALGLVGAGGWFAYARIFPIFLANPWLNGFILTVFFVGLLACFWQVVQLVKAVSWIEGFAADRPGRPQHLPPSILAPLVALLGGHEGGRRQIAATSARSILESVATRIDEARDITRYVTNLLIFLGLLGTFYGLATTVPAVVETIRALAPQEGESGLQVFDKLMSGLEAQLGGMGTAFSSSLLGLAGSLVVGLLELFVTHGQNRFYRELEEWISSITRLSFTGAEGEGEQSMVAGILDHMAEQMSMLRDLFAETEAGRIATDERLNRLADGVVALSDHLGSEIKARSAQAAALQRMAEGQARLTAALEANAARMAEAGDEFDIQAEMRMRLRSIDTQMLRMLEELTAGRQESLAELHNDFAALTRAVLTRNAQER